MRRLAHAAMIEGLAHVHSTYSYDGKLTLEELKDECRKRNLQFIFLTEHAEDFDSKKMEIFVAQCRSMSDESFIMIPGLEFVVDIENDVHLLACGLSEMPDDNSFESIYAAVKQSGGFTAVAHPSRNNYCIPSWLKGKIDGIEIWNAAYDSRYLPSDKSYRLLSRLKADNPELLGFAGLDLHDYSGFRNVCIRLMDICSSQNELLQCIKTGRYCIRNTVITLRPDRNPHHMLLGFLSLARMFLNVADRMKRRWKSMRGMGVKAVQKTSKKRASSKGDL